MHSMLEAEAEQLRAQVTAVGSSGLSAQQLEEKVVARHLYCIMPRIYCLQFVMGHGCLAVALEAAAAAFATEREVMAAVHTKEIDTRELAT